MTLPSLLHANFNPKFLRAGHATRDPESADRYSTFRIQIANRLGLHFPETGVTSTLEIYPERGITKKRGITMHVDIRELPTQRLATIEQVTIEHRGHYNRISEAFTKLEWIAGIYGLLGPQAAMIALHFDDPESTPANELRAEAAIAVPTDSSLPPGVGERSLAGGRYACTVHSGGYELIGDTWVRFMGQWLPQSGHRMADGPSAI